jgi:hypothetical protein
MCPGLVGGNGALAVLKLSGVRSFVAEFMGLQELVYCEQTEF